MRDKKKPGRKPLPGGGAITVAVSFTRQDHDTLKRIGDGSLSKGIRRLVEHHRQSAEKFMEWMRDIEDEDQDITVKD